MRLHHLRPSLFAFILLLSPTNSGQADELRNFDDAALRAVQFLNAKEGWAVGDEGVVWQTIDGGKTWDRQSTGVRASLRSVHFLNAFVGWVAGREELPGGQSAGVVLFTDDGGVKWQRLLVGTLPGLNFVHFVDDRTGYLAGDGSDQYPSGVFVTGDSGRTWRPVAGPRYSSWLAGDCSKDRAVLVGAWGRLGTLKPDRVVLADADSLAGQALCGVHFQGSRAFAVGQGGLVLTSEANSKDWGVSESTMALPLDVRQSWDFHAVHGAGSHVWMVGRPGSAVLHSRNNGDNWEVQYTRQTLPLNGLFFVDEHTGWAVGEMGTILGTTDGGKTWKTQRRGGERSAALFIHARATGVPLDAAALLGGQDGYLTTSLRVVCPDPATAAAARCVDGERLAAAWRQAGGASAEMLWQFPLSAHDMRASREEMLKTWDAMHGGKAADNLLRQMVLAIRLWKPDLIVTDCFDAAATGFPCERLTAEAVREAFRRAADPKAFPEHVNFLGLEAWQPAKLYSRWEGRADAEVKLDLTEVSPPLRATIQEFASVPAGLLTDGATVPRQRNYRFFGGVQAAQAHTKLMEGITLEPGGPARRSLADRGAMTDDEKKAIQQRTLLKNVIETPGEMATPERLLGKIGPLLAEMPDDMAARAAYAVADQMARAGKWALASETYLLMADRYPAHPLTVEALRWLIRHGSSSEVRRRYELKQFAVGSQVEYGVVGTGKQTVALPTKDKGPERKFELPSIEEKRETEVYVHQMDASRWYKGPLDLEKRLASFGPLFANDPATQFCLQSARRNLGQIDDAKKWYGLFASKQPEGPWKAAALAELWLLDHQGAPPKPVVACRYTESKPFLDGKLDDPCWKDAAVLRLVPAGSDRRNVSEEARKARADFVKDYPTEVRLAYDREYLYVAVRCFHPVDKHVEPVKARTRDADLRPFDRVSILLDLDRDYATYYHLQIDQRGCVAEDCWGDRTWDPRWFVAVQSEPGMWIAEAAIPLDALTSEGVRPGRAWAFNAIRVLPGRGVQAWSLPAEVPEEAPRPEGMGLLLFTQDGPTPMTNAR
jgi:photosystem II stability/assembly factor-like uncharacterized protein